MVLIGLLAIAELSHFSGRVVGVANTARMSRLHDNRVLNRYILFYRTIRISDGLVDCDRLSEFLCSLNGVFEHQLLVKIRCSCNGCDFGKSTIACRAILDFFTGKTIEYSGC